MPLSCEGSSTVFSILLQEREGFKVEMMGNISRRGKKFFFYSPSSKDLFFMYCVDHSKLWKILKEMGIPDHLTCLLRNLYVVQEATVRTGHGTTDWFQIGKGVRQGCILSPCLFNLYAEYIMNNARLEEVQNGIKIARRNINNLR